MIGLYHIGLLVRYCSSRSEEAQKDLSKTDQYRTIMCFRMLRENIHVQKGFNNGLHVLLDEVFKKNFRAQRRISLIIEGFPLTNTD